MQIVAVVTEYILCACRYSCATCVSFDLCSSCEEGELYIRDSESVHDPSHVMLKAKLPLPESRLIQARSRAGSLLSGYEGDQSLFGEHVRLQPHQHPPNPPYWRHGPPPPHFNRGPPPGGPWGPPPPGPWDWNTGAWTPRHPGHGPPPEPWHERWRGPGHHHGYGKGPRGPPPIYLINTGGAGTGASVQRLDSLEHLNIANAGHMNLPHNVVCSSCSQHIFGIRWLCANCPTQPTTDLVSYQTAYARL